MSAGCEMRRIEYLLRLSVRVSLRCSPRLSTPSRPSKKRMTCFVLIFNFYEKHIPPHCARLPVDDDP